MPWDFALILILLGFVVPWRGAVRVRQIMSRPELATSDRLTLYSSTIAFQWFAAAVVFWRSAAHALSAIDLALSTGNNLLRTALIAAVLTPFLAAIQLASLRRLRQLPADKQGFFLQLQLKLMPHNTAERLVFLALVTTAAICEEFLYRGFVQAVFQNLPKSTLLVGVLASAAFFAIAHSYQGRRGVAATFTVGLIFSAVRSVTGSLLPSMLAHFATDLLVGLLGPSAVRTVVPATAALTRRLRQ